MTDKTSTQVGQEMYRFITELYPICRSITGDGVRETLRLIRKHIPLEIHEIPSGTKVFDWTVPQEWNIQDAYIKNNKGERVVDFKKSNLHVVSYSQPIHTKMTLGELKPHLHTLPESPEWIPWRTSYYKESWGFCLTHKQFQTLQDEEYEVCIQSSLEKGSLTYGEYVIPGQTTEEVLISVNVCHPSLCNDNLSGTVLAIHLAKKIRSEKPRYTYRFLFIPTTIGSIAWLSGHEKATENIRHGIVLTCVGDSGGFTYKKSRRGNAEIDQVFSHVFKHSQCEYTIIEFFPYGYDERQYCSPGFNLPVGCFMRTPHGQYPEYHTSGDNLTFVQPQFLEESFSYCLQAMTILERNKTFMSQNPKCEPQLGKRGIYKVMGGQSDGAKKEMPMLWMLNLSDGHHSVLEIAERSGLPFDVLYEAAEILVDHGLLKAITR